MFDGFTLFVICIPASMLHHQASYVLAGFSYTNYVGLDFYLISMLKIINCNFCLEVMQSLMIPGAHGSHV